MRFLFPFFFSLFLISCEYEDSENSDDWDTVSEKKEYVLFSTTDSTELVNRETAIIEKSWKSEDPVIVSAFTTRSAFAYYSNYDPMLYRGVRTEKTTFEQNGNFDKIELYDLEGNLRWKYQISPSNYSFHGNIYPLDNGDILIQGWERVSNEELYQLGRLHAGLPEGGYTILERIVELRPNITNGSTKVIWEWNLKNELIQDKYLSDSNYVANPLLSNSLDINHHAVESGIDWAGTEAMAFNEDRDHIVFYFKNFGVVSIMDRKSGKFIFKQDVDNEVISLNWKNDLIALLQTEQTKVTVENLETTYTGGKYVEDSLQREKILTIKNMPEEVSFDFDTDGDKSYMIVDRNYNKSWKIEYNEVSYKTWSWEKVWELQNNSNVNNAKIYWSDELGF
jgi:hypothetical protein